MSVETGVVRPRPVRRLQGFSLLELLVAMVILLILATLAYPSYSQHLRKARRVEATLELLRVGRGLEQCFSANASYLRDADGDGTEDCRIPDVGISPSGDYQISIGPRTASRYVLTAIPVPGGRQQADAACTSLVLDSAGGKSATGSQPGRCWQ